MHYYRFNIADYRKDTGFLTYEEHGIYRCLIDQYHLDEHPLTLDLRRLMRMLGLTSDQKETLLRLLDDFFEMTETGYKHRKIDSNVAEYHAKSDKAKSSARVRWDAKESERNANAMRTQCDSNANHKPLTKVASKMLPLPDEINILAWAEFEQHRKDIRKPLSKLARTKAINILIPLTSEQQAETIDRTIQNRWTGLFPEKSKDGTYQRNNESNHAQVMRRLGGKAGGN